MAENLYSHPIEDPTTCLNQNYSHNKNSNNNLNRTINKPTTINTFNANDKNNYHTIYQQASSLKYIDNNNQLCNMNNNTLPLKNHYSNIRIDQFPINTNTNSNYINGNTNNLNINHGGGISAAIIVGNELLNCSNNNQNINTNNNIQNYSETFPINNQFINNKNGNIGSVDSSTCLNHNRYKPYQNRSFGLPLDVNARSNNKNNNNNINTTNNTIIINNGNIQNYQQSFETNGNHHQQQELQPYKPQQYHTNSTKKQEYCEMDSIIHPNENINTNNSYKSDLNTSFSTTTTTSATSIIHNTNNNNIQQQQQQINSNTSTLNIGNNNNNSLSTLNEANEQHVTLQINNLDYSLGDANIHCVLMNQLKSITPIISLVYEGTSHANAKVTVPDLHFAKQVVVNLHHKKIGHKRLVVSYTRDSSLTEIKTLRCQVAGLLKDVPFCTLPMFKFRELFQSRFKTSISVLDLYKMPDICTITPGDDKIIKLNSELIKSIKSNPECLQDSAPYCTAHFQYEPNKGWAEQEIAPLPNVFMTIMEIKEIVNTLLRTHHGDIPIRSIVHCIIGQLNIEIIPNENGINLEHLICCINDIEIITNSYGVKVLKGIDYDKKNSLNKSNLNHNYNHHPSNNDNHRNYHKNGHIITNPLHQISREVIELIKLSPKATMKFSRFIPAYHNHFGKQCRVADYGYTKLIELFEALSNVVQIMGEGENRQVTLTHRVQIRRFTTDLLRLLRSQGNKSMLISQLSDTFTQIQNRTFDITDYGVCSIYDILDGLVNSNIIVLSSFIQNNNNSNNTEPDMLITIPKRKQTIMEFEKTCVFTTEIVELFRNALNYSIPFQKFVRSYHYHFGYQCRLSDYGFFKLNDLIESVHGIIDIEYITDDDKKLCLSSKFAQRVFTEQLENLIYQHTGQTNACIKLDDILDMHKKKFGYRIHGQTLGFTNIIEALQNLPYIEFINIDGIPWIICHINDMNFRKNSYQAILFILESGINNFKLCEFLIVYGNKCCESFTEQNIKDMKHAIQITDDNNIKYVEITPIMKFIINIIQFIDQRCLSIIDIKTSLEICNADCYKYGYPNLYTLFKGFPDIFNCMNNKHGQERTEISLILPGEFSSILKSYHNQSEDIHLYNIHTKASSSSSPQSILSLQNSQSDIVHKLESDTIYQPSQLMKTNNMNQLQNAELYNLKFENNNNSRTLNQYSSFNLNDQQHSIDISQNNPQESSILYATSLASSSSNVFDSNNNHNKTIENCLNYTNTMTNNDSSSIQATTYNDNSFNSTALSSLIELNSTMSSLPNSTFNNGIYSENNSSFNDINNNINNPTNNFQTYDLNNNQKLALSETIDYNPNTTTNHDNNDSIVNSSLAKLWDRDSMEYFYENIQYNHNNDIFNLYNNNNNNNNPTYPSHQLSKSDDTTTSSGSGSGSGSGSTLQQQTLPSLLFDPVWSNKNINQNSDTNSTSNEYSSINKSVYNEEILI